jgi:aldehyde:ferredoxin oxidoreductase
MELSGVNIKGCASMGLTLATSDFASHTRFWSASDEMAGNLTFENTPEYVKKGQDEVNARNSLIVCDFLPFGFDRLAPIYESLTGIRMDESRLMEIGEKISNLTRMINIRNGRTRRDDSLPQRFFKEKHLAGIFKGEFMSPEIFSKWLDMYYRSRGWDSEGVPTDATLKRLGVNRL